jgi:thiol-disulfide isomerase/thioredoxin
MSKTIGVLFAFLFSTIMIFADTDTDALFAEFKHKISATDKSSPNYKKLLTYYQSKFDEMKSFAINNMQFDRSKRIREILVSIAKGEFDTLDSVKKVEEKIQIKKPELSAFIKENFSEGLTDKDGKTIAHETLAGKFIGIYFSAHWCPPCRAFTPTLVKFRDENQVNFEVFFVSSDECEAKRKEYISETNMKWLMVKFKGQNAKNLNNKFQISGIPALIIISPTGEIISGTGREDIINKYDKALKDWNATENMTQAIKKADWPSYEAASKDYIDCNPKSHIGYYNLARSQFFQDHIDDGFTSLDKSTQFGLSDLTYVKNDLAFKKHEVQENKRWVEISKKVLDNKEKEKYMIELSNYYYANKFEQAISVCDKIDKKYPLDANIAFWAALCYGNLGNKNETLKYLERYISLEDWDLIPIQDYPAFKNFTNDPKYLAIFAKDKKKSEELKITSNAKK